MEGFIRKPIEYNQDSIKIQALEWLDFNEPVDSEGGSDVAESDGGEDEDAVPDNKYLVRAFGVDAVGQSVCINITDFTPFFYVKVPGSWTKNNVKTFLDNLTSVVGYYNGRAYRPLYKWSKYILRDKCLIQKKKDFYGFSNNKIFTFVRLTFNNSEAMKKTMYIINNHNDDDNKTKITGVNFKLKLYETNLDPTLRLIHVRHLKPSGWIEAKDVNVITNKAEKKSHCQIEVTTSWTNVYPLDINTNAPILQASFDIETYSHDGSFPSPDVDSNCVFQIATAFKIFGTDKFYLKHIICLKECAPITESEDGVKVIMEWYNTEKEVLLAWKRLLIAMDPDILYSYNGDCFDCNYLCVRAKKLKCNESFLLLGKLKDSAGKLLDKSFSSSAHGTSNYKRLSIPGRINFDILIYIQREYKENSYKLDSISEKYIGANKNPVTPQMMFDYFASGDPEKICEVAKYCIQDTLLPQRLVDKMHILQNQISMSNITYVSIKTLTERGQQIKVYSQILKETRKQDYLVPSINNYRKDGEAVPDEDESFTGATVLPPLSGAYFSPITVCDFASLYPSIIRAHNLCFSTIVLDEEKYGNIDGVDYETIEWEDTNEKTGVVTSHSFKYCQSTPGVLPGLLSNLTKARKDYKNLMAQAEDPFTKGIYDKCQLAVKVSMNSIYGFLAAPMLQCKPIAATVTAIGRNMIGDTKKFMEDNYEASCAVYGDSVLGNTPLLLRIPSTGDIVIKTIEDIAGEDTWGPYEEFKPFDTNRRHKQQSTVEYETWSGAGWNPIIRVIRHKTRKQIYRVTTNKGCVDVTEDHSLIAANGRKVKPCECSRGTQLRHSFPEPDNIQFYDIDLNSGSPGSTNSIEIVNDALDEAFIYGLFFGDGVAYMTSQESKNRWGIISNSKDLLSKAQEYITTSELGTSFDIKFDDPGTRPGNPGEKYILIPSSNSVEYITQKYLKLFYNENGHKIIPTKILNGDLSIRKRFCEGMFNTCLNKNKERDFDRNPLLQVSNKLTAMHIYYIVSTLGYSMSVHSSTGKCDTFWIYNDNGFNSNAFSCIKKIVNIGYNETNSFVYDLETSKGTYLAGVGSLIVSNTDSVFIKYNTKSVKKYEKEYERIHSHVVITEDDKTYLKSLKAACIQESIDVGKEAANRATKELFKAPISLEYEKVYCPLLLLSKKRYIGELYSEDPHQKDKMDNKGVVLKRRDNFDLLKTTYQHIIDIFMEEGQNGLDKVVEYINGIINDLVTNKINIDSLVVSKALKGPYKSQNIPHVVLAKKLAERNPTNPPRSNDRIPYIFIDNGWTKIVPQYTKVEDPVYVKEHGLPLDTEYYIKFLMNPICEILELFQDNPYKIFKDAIVSYKKERKTKQMKLTHK